MKTIQLFPNKIALQLSDDHDYRVTVDAPRGLIPTNLFGRGIARLNKAVEFQTAMVATPEILSTTISSKSFDNSLPKAICTSGRTLCITLSVFKIRSGES